METDDDSNTSEETVFEPAEPSRQLIEAASWRLATEVIRRYPSKLTLIETHPGGGQYDCLSLYARDPSLALAHINLNRVGSVFVFNRDYPEGWSWVWRGAWAEMVSSDSPKSLVDRLCAHAQFPPRTGMQATTPTTIVFRVIAAFLAQSVFGQVRAECRNGYEDTSGDGGGVRQWLFESFPAARERLAVREPDDLLEISAYRFWFLSTEDSQESVAFETTTGRAWTVDGREYDLLALYRANGRRVWPVVAAVAADLLG